MVVPTLLTLTGQRIMAGNQFLGFAPVGSYYYYQGEVCVVTGLDQSTGWLTLRAASNGSNVITVDPIALLYPNAAPDPSVVVKTPPTPNPNGFSISSAAGLGGTAAQIYQSSKLGKSQGSGGGPGVSDWSKQNGGASQSSIGPKTDLTPLQVNQKAEIAKVAEAKSALAGLKADQLDAQTALAKAQQDLKFADLNYNPDAPGSIYDANLTLGSYELQHQFDQAIQVKINENFDILHNQFNKVEVGSPEAIALMAKYDRNMAQIQYMKDATPTAAEADQQAADNLSQKYSDATHAVESRQAHLDAFPSRIQAATDNIEAANQLKIVTDAQLQTATTFKAMSEGLKSQANDLFTSMDTPQKEKLYFEASKELQDQGVDPKAVNFDQQVQDYAKNKYVNEMSVLTPEDQASFLSQAKEDAFIRYNEEGNFDPRITKPSDLPNSDPYVQDELAHQTPNLDKNFLQKRSVTATQGDLKKFNSDLRAQEIKFAAELATAGAAAYGELRAIESMFENGYSFKLLAGALAAAGTVWASLHFAHSMLTANFSPIMNLIQGLHFKLPLIGTINYGKALGSALKFTTGNYGTAGIIGGMALIGWLLRNKTDEAQAAAENLNAQVNPMVWNPNGAVVFLTAGLTMASMGINLSPSAPLMQTMTLPSARVTAALQSAGATVPTDNTRYSDVFVQQGAPGQPTRVVYLTNMGTDSKGNVIEKVTVQTLKSNFQFATQQPPTGFIPFFIPGPNGTVTPNPDVVTAMSSQQHLLQCADGTWVTDATRCVNGALPLSHALPGQ